MTGHKDVYEKRADEIDPLFVGIIPEILESHSWDVRLRAQPYLFDLHLQQVDE